MEYAGSHSHPILSVNHLPSQTLIMLGKRWAGVTETLNPIQRKRPEGKEEQDLHHAFIFTVCRDL